MDRRSFIRACAILGAGTLGSPMLNFAQEPNAPSTSFNSLIEYLDSLNPAEIATQSIRKVPSLNYYSEDYKKVYKDLSSIGAENVFQGVNLPIVNLHSEVTNSLLKEIIRLDGKDPFSMEILSDSTLMFSRPLHRFVPNMWNVVWESESELLSKIKSGMQIINKSGFALNSQGDFKYAQPGMSFINSQDSIFGYENKSILEIALKNNPAILLTALGTVLPLRVEGISDRLDQLEGFAEVEASYMLKFTRSALENKTLPIFVSPPNYFITEDSISRFGFSSKDDTDEYKDIFFGPSYRWRIVMSVVRATIVTSLGLPFVNTLAQIQKVESDYMFQHGDYLHYQDPHAEHKGENRTPWDLDLKETSLECNTAVIGGTMMATALAEIAHKTKLLVG